MTTPTATACFPRAAGRAERAPLIAAALLLALAVPVCAQAAEAGVTAGNAWMRYIVPARPAGGYLDVANDSDEARAIVGASSPACAGLMLHQSMTKGGMGGMKAVERVDVPAHGEAHFAPGGFHLMCMQPTAAVRPGKSVPVTLKFDDGGTLTVDFAVRDAKGE